MTQQEKLALQKWEEFHKGFARKIDADTTLTSHQIERQRMELEADPVRWIKYFFPSYAKYDFAPFHLKAIKRLIEHDEWYEVLSWSRELAKSTIVMMVVCYLVLTGRKRFIALASASEKSAIKLLTPYRISFESNARIRQFYGDLPVVGAYEKLDFSLRNGARFVGMGAGSSPRGMKNEEVRPDVVLVDDYDEDEACRNPQTLQNRWEWFNEALFPTRSISEPLLVVWCGNIIAKDCCITRAGALADNWDVINIRDKEGRSTWPAKNTEKHIDRVLSKMPKSSQQKEYFNNPVIEGKIFTNLVYGRIPALKKFKHIIIYGDPAPGESKKTKASYKAVWATGILDNKLYILKGFCAQGLQSEFIRWYADLYKWVDNKTNVYLFIENNKLQDPFFQKVFKPLAAKLSQEEGIVLNIKPDTEPKTDKSSRIESNLDLYKKKSDSQHQVLNQALLRA